MRQSLFIVFIGLTVIALISFTRGHGDEHTLNLRKIYSQSPDKWPAPSVDSGVKWKELNILPASPLAGSLDSLKHLISLGKILFFEPRLSGSGTISCASCHQPELSWTDGKKLSEGHDGTINKRNSPSIQNVWFYKKLFWDGRSRDLEDQAFAPINSESEMHGDMRHLPIKLKKVAGYATLFHAAFGDPAINPDRIATALAVFQRTIVSNPSNFDAFLSGKKNALTQQELRGFHLFRTKARCINCHHGALFTDNQFHNNGFHLNGDPSTDPGLYNVTHKDDDIGKFKTPSLRDVMKTGPWMHNGHMQHIEDILSHYNSGAKSKGNRDQLIKPLLLTNQEINDLQAFLQSISAPPVPFEKPVLPQ
jgi:cytochrome c peroxidase